MKTALMIMLVFAAADLLVGGFLLVIVGLQYRSVRRVAAVHGHPLSAAAGQFAFLGGMVVVGIAILSVAILGLWPGE